MLWIVLVILLAAGLGVGLFFLLRKKSSKPTDSKATKLVIEVGKVSTKV